jgi:hypothetical protein
MSNYKELDEALALVETLATTEQIQALLRTRKGDKNVRIGAENKNAVVFRNLREAVEKRAIDIESVFNLIRDSEENGNQHIFYYKPKSRAIATALSFENIAPQLFGSRWEKKLEDDFPQIKLKPNDFKTSDFRRLQKKPQDWILKIYGQTTIEKLTAEQELEGTTALWRKFNYEELRIVLMARWNSPDLLEVRVQRDSSRRRVEGWHNIVWETLKPHIIRGQFDAWGLSNGMKNLMSKHAGNEKIYNFRDAKVIDTDIHVTFQAYSDIGTLFEREATSDSLQGYLDAKSEWDGITVTWLPQTNNIPVKETRTFLGVKQSMDMQKRVGSQSNEVIVQAHCSAEDLDYVTGQLRQFNK